MNTNYSTQSLNSSFEKEQGKDNDFKAQKLKVFEYLQHNTATASMISDATGVPQKNITRYKRDLELSGRLWEVKKGYCELTTFSAHYLTTNPDLAPSENQLSIFQNL